MPPERLVSSYLLRVAVKNHRWHLTLHDLKAGKSLDFTSFETLLEHLERASAEPGVPKDRR